MSQQNLNIPQAQTPSEPALGSATKESVKAVSKAVVVYLTDGGLYSTTPNSGPNVRLTGSDHNSQLLASSPDGQLLCYTSGENKAYTLDLKDNKAEVFNYPIDHHALQAGYAPYAAFVQNGKGLIFLPGGLFRSPYARTPQRYSDRVMIKAPNLFYRALGSNQELQAIDKMAVIAEPRFDDSTIYYEPLPQFSQSATPTQVVSYDLNTGKETTIAASNKVIDAIFMSKDAQEGSRDAVFYLTIDVDSNLGLANYQIYSKASLDSKMASLLINTEPINVQKGKPQVVTPPTNVVKAIAVIPGNISSVFILDPLEGQATSLNIQTRDNALGEVTEAQFSPNGGKLMIIGANSNSGRLWYTVTDSTYHTVLPASDYPASSNIFSGWLDDNIYYNYDLNKIRVIDTNTGKITVLADQAQNQSSMELLKPVGLLSDGRTALYIQGGAMYSSDLDNPHPTKLISNVRDAWLIHP